MGNKLYVGNLAYSVRDESLQESFGQFGTVTSAKVMMDRDTGRSKGFGFVEMSSSEQAAAAIRGLNGQAIDGRALVVNEARPKEDRPGGHARKEHWRDVLAIQQASGVRYTQEALSKLGTKAE